MRKIFFDLEGTLINSWSDVSLCNIERVRNIIKEHGITEISIFSFAIDNENDVRTFEKDGFKNFIERAYEIKIVECPTTKEIMSVCLKYSGNLFDLFEFKSVWGKTRAFQEYCTALYKDTACMLIDDVVPNTTLYMHDKGLTISTIKI